MIAETRDKIVAALTVLVRRRTRLRRDVAIEVALGLIGALASSLATDSGAARASTALLALLAIWLAARDRRHLELVQRQIDTLARAVAQFV